MAAYLMPQPQATNGQVKNEIEKRKRHNGAICPPVDISSSLWISKLASAGLWRGRRLVARCKRP